MVLDTARPHERRDTILGKGEGLSVGTSVNSSIKLGAYAGILDNLNLAGINNPSPNLTTVYLDTPLVGPTPETLEYVPSPGRLGQPSGYPPSITRTSIGGARRRPPPPSSPLQHPSTDASSDWSGATAQVASGNETRKNCENFSPMRGTLSKILYRGVGEA